MCGYALATRLVPDHVERPASSLGFRLAGVFAYPNALGIVAVLGLLLALGSSPTRPAALFGRPQRRRRSPLALALYLSNSRGSWIALAIGLVAAAALSPARQRVVRAFVPLAAIGALAIWLVSR